MRLLNQHRPNHNLKFVHRLRNIGDNTAVKLNIINEIYDKKINILEVIDSM